MAGFLRDRPFLCLAGCYPLIINILDYRGEVRQSVKGLWYPRVNAYLCHAASGYPECVITFHNAYVRGKSTAATGMV